MREKLFWRWENSLIPVAVALTATVLGTAFGEELPPFGKEPVLKPATSSWTVAFESAPVTGTGETATSTPILKGARMVSQTVTRSGEIRRIENRFENGAVMEIWVRAAMAAQRSPDYPQVIIRLREGLYASDFPELDWLNSRTFAGETRRDGRTFWKFQMESFPLRFRDRGLFDAVMNSEGGSDSLDLGNPVRVEALVDAESRLPVELKIANDVRRYQFSSASVPALALPQDVLVAMGDVQQRFDAISKPLSRP